jgi:glutamate synthase domain-containing protein 3
MSGGIAYLVDNSKQSPKLCNREMVSLTALTDQAEIEFVKDMIFRHAEYTGSRRATEILLAWDQFVANIVRVLPHDYRRVIEKAAVAHV